MTRSLTSGKLHELTGYRCKQTELAAAGFDPHLRLLLPALKARRKGLARRQATKWDAGRLRWPELTTALHTQRRAALRSGADMWRTS
jgi:hypothetical protein